MIANLLIKNHKIDEERALKMGCAVAGVFNKKDGKPLASADPEMETLFFAAPSQIEAFADLAFKEWGENKVISANKSALRKSCNEVGCYDAADIALFGRMVAAESDLTMEGAALFSHALSTHKADNETDYFSAVDDEKKMSEDAGAAMLGVLEFSSAVYYRYAGINLDLLFDQSNGHLKKCDIDQRMAIVKAFIHSTLLSIPTARKNSMNGDNPPAYVLGICKEVGQPVQLINAFEKPVRAPFDGGFIERSVALLNEHYISLKKTWNIQTVDEVSIPDVGIDEFCNRLTAYVK